MHARRTRTGRRRRSAGTNSPADCWLARGRVPGEVPGQQRAAGVEPCGNAGLFFCCSIPERCEQKVHHRGREQLVPAVPRPGRQKRPCGAFLERGRVPGEVPGQQRATGVEPYGVSRHGGLLLVCTLGGLFRPAVRGAQILPGPAIFSMMAMQYPYSRVRFKKRSARAQGLPQAAVRDEDVLLCCCCLQ